MERELRLNGFLGDNFNEAGLINMLKKYLLSINYEIVELQELDDVTKDIDDKATHYWTQLCAKHAKAHNPGYLDKFPTDCLCGVAGCKKKSEYHLDIRDEQIRSKGTSHEWMIIRTARKKEETCKYTEAI